MIRLSPRDLINEKRSDEGPRKLNLIHRVVYSLAVLLVIIRNHV